MASREPSSRWERAREALRLRIAKTLGKEGNDAQQQALLDALLQGVDIRKCKEAFADLLEAGYRPSRLMLLLLQSQPIIFKLLADPQRPSEWRDIFSRFYRLQDSIISLSESIDPILNDTEITPPDETGANDTSPQTDSHAPVISHPANAQYIAWLQQQERVRLFNTFRGVVINAYCELLHIDTERDRISVELNHELGRVLTADPSHESAILVANEEATTGFPLRLVDHNAGIAIFEVMPSKRLYIDQRGNIDVQIQDLVHVDILRGLYRYPTATLIDFSASGIGVMAPKDERMKIRRGDTLEFRFQIGAAKVIAEGTVRGLREQDDRYILGVALNVNRATQSLLQREVFRVQREIIVALNEEGIPEEIADNIR